MLLVLGITRCMGRAQPGWYLLASPPRVFGGDYLPRRGDRVRSQLDQESNFALRPHRSDIPDCRRYVSSFKHAPVRSRPSFGMVNRRHRNGFFISAGVALRSPFSTMLGYNQAEIAQMSDIATPNLPSATSKRQRKSTGRWVSSKPGGSVVG